ncbi:hypothetical protein Cni_G22469 [Canna indica]|uniref:Uncharacterized protein n=1 Tax=Canna indica TaxID=4628 RepID=A0AAQ3QMP0_9LILI|nr:hypothetical protein Cni_G22469 [Canna indica]
MLHSIEAKVEGLPEEGEFSTKVGGEVRRWRRQCLLGDIFGNGLMMKVTFVNHEDDSGLPSALVLEYLIFGERDNLRALCKILKTT